LFEEEHPVDFLPELALGVLGDEESAALREHLAGCEACTAEFEVMSKAARLLPYAGDEAEPRPEMREGLMERIASEPVVLRAKPARPAWQRLSAIAAALVLLFGAGAVVGVAVSGSDDLKEETERQQTLVRAVAEGDARRETAEDGDTRAVLVYAPDAESAFAMLEGLPALGDGKAYQAWFIADGPPLPSDVFTSAEEGVWLTSPEEVASFAAFALTIEDEDGADAPTQEPFLVMALGQSASARQPFTMREWLALTMRD